ncbi:MAG: GntR family transcriptional regulator [Thiothrix sp.]|nr:GntR family transcriptional regulator [Thiothrix sp.]HPE62151.1 GntR family transcriptional regulator [Thiolinea sp.]
MTMEPYIRQHASLLEGGDAPMYQRLAGLLRQGINDHSLERDQPLPGERDLANLLSVSRVTVRRALGILVSEGLLTQRQGAGTFIASRMEQPLGHLTSFTEDMQHRRLVSGVVWLERSRREASVTECGLLALDAGEQVASLYRLRTANEEPLALEHAVLSARLLPEPETLNGSLYRYLDALDSRPVRATQRLRAVPCDQEQATLLRVTPGSPVLYIERHSFLADGTPVEFTRSHYRGDSYDFVSEMAIRRTD